MFWFKIKKIPIFFLFFLFVNEACASNEVIISLKDGGKIVFIRHSFAPGNGDPENFILNDCSTQRNLNEKGVEQSRKIGNFFIANKIKIDAVLSSEWCRCKDTAFYAFSNFEIFDALNSFYSEKFHENKNKQIKNLKEFISNWDNKSNLVLVTHYVVILELFGVGAGSGEIIISNKNYEIVDRIEIN